LESFLKFKSFTKNAFLFSTLEAEVLQVFEELLMKYNAHCALL